MNELSESLSDYQDRWHRLLPLPQTSAWSTPVAQEVLEGIARDVLECTCDISVLMCGGCRCGTMKQEREVKS